MRSSYFCYDLVESGENVQWLPGTVMVRLAEKDYREGDIILADNVKKGLLGMGTVVGKSDDVSDLDLADIVVFYRTHGKIIKNWTWPCGRVEEDRVAIFGRCYCRFVGVTEELNWWDSVIGKMDAGEFRPTGNNVLIDIGDKSEESAGGILLPGNAQYRDDTGRVISVGPLVKDVKPGDVVVFSRRSLVQMHAIERNTALIPDIGIYCVLEELDAH